MKPLKPGQRFWRNRLGHVVTVRLVDTKGEVAVIEYGSDRHKVRREVALSEVWR